MTDMPISPQELCDLLDYNDGANYPLPASSPEDEDIRMLSFDLTFDELRY